MTKVQRRHFERRLLEERADTLGLLNRTTSEAASQNEQGRAGDLSQWPTHMADRGTDTIGEELTASNATRRWNACTRTPNGSASVKTRAGRFRCSASRSSRGRARAGSVPTKAVSS